MKNVFCYVRVSTSEQVKEGYSIDEQTERLNAFCKAKDWTVLRFFVDGGFSGANTKRPALQEMIAEIKAGKGDMVVVYKLDRLSRSQKDTLALIEDTFLANKVDFVSMTENFDTSTPFGKAMIGILSVFAQLERETIKERTSIGREGRAKEGKWQGGGWIPIGYDYIDDELVLNEYEAMQIREIHRLYQSGNSIKEIARIMEQKGLTHKNGKWSPNRVKMCFLNDLYIGNVHFNGQTFKGNHAPVMDEETFFKTKAIYESHDYTNCRNHGKKSLLASILFCKQCGARYGMTIYRSDNRYYTCYSRRKSNLRMVKDPNCKNKGYKAETLEKMVFDEIRKLSLDTSQLSAIQKENKEEKEALIRKEIEKLDSQQSRLIDLYSIGQFSKEEITAKIAQISEKRNKLDAELKLMKKPSLSVKEATRMVESFDDILEKGNETEIRQIILSLIEKIEIDNDDIYIHWRFC